MKELILSKWDEVLTILEKDQGLTSMVINTWLKPLTIYDIEDNTIYFTVDEFLGDRGVHYIKNKMYDLYLVTVLRDVLNNDSIKIFIDTKENFEKSKNTEVKEEIVFSDEYTEAVARNSLNPKYTFDTFIVGESNKHAHATCIAVADAPGMDKFNPLFLYGGTGLGKTHLMQSIAHYILKKNKNAKLLYLPANKFTNEIVEAIKKNKTDEFRKKYRNLDILLVDDVQSLIGKESTQQEFFDTFNALYDEGKQIILSSDKPPKEIKTLDERFRSRFEWGIPIDIHSPDYETRMAILKNKVELNGLSGKIGDNILEYIASTVTYNVRELEGALNKISIYAELGNIDLDETLVREILKDIVSKENAISITPELIINKVSEHLHISKDDIISSKRSQDIANARQISMYLCRQLTSKGLKSIGDIFGGKDHSTVHSNINRVEKKISEDPEFKETIDVIIKKINPNN